MGKLEQLPQIDLDSAIGLAVDQEPNSIEDASRAFLSILGANEKLYRSIHDAMIERAAKELVRDAMVAKRNGLFRRTPVRAERVGCISSVVKTRGSLYEYLLTDLCKPLKDATRDEVLAMETMHRKLAEGNTQKANWFASIAKRMGDGKTVGEAMDDGTLRQLAHDSGLTSL